MKYQTFVGPEVEVSTSGEESYASLGLLKTPSVTGYSVWTASIFITSLMAGMGVLALPNAMAGTGWLGLAVIALACVNSGYCAVVLGRLWLIMEERWEEYRDKFRYPYPAMGLRAVGPWMRYTVTGSLHLTLLGIATVYILLSAQIALSLTANFIHLSHNYWLLLLAGVLCPLTWFGSIEEFRFAGFGALATAALACYSLFASILMHNTSAPNGPPDPDPTFESFSLAFGTILFSFGGVFFIPTIQNDMADRGQFPKSAAIAFTGLLLLYLPVTIGGYAVLGSSVTPNLLTSISSGYLKTLIEVSLAVHVLLAFLLVINPVAQEIEEALGVESNFNWKRCCVRSVILLIILLIAYIVPHFDKILNLIGGSTITLLTFIFPPLFYILLTKEEKPGWVERKISKWEMLFFIQIIITGIAGGAACTYFAIIDIFAVLMNKESQTVAII